MNTETTNEEIVKTPEQITNELNNKVQTCFEALHKAIYGDKRQPEKKHTEDEVFNLYKGYADTTATAYQALVDAREELRIHNLKDSMTKLDLATKLAVLGLSKEELAAHLGLSATPITDTTPTVDTDTSIIIKYLTPTGEVETVKLESVYQRITTENFSSDVVKFWEWAQAQTEAKTITRPKKRGDGTTVVKVDKPYLKDVSDDELKELCKAYYAAA